MTLRTTRPYAAMGRYSDLDRFRLLVTQHLHFVIYEAHKSLHPVQNGLNLKLNSWFPPFDSFCLDNKRLSRLARSAILPSGPAKRRQALRERNLPRNSRLETHPYR